MVGEIDTGFSSSDNPNWTSAQPGTGHVQSKGTSVIVRLRRSLMIRKYFCCGCFANSCLNIVCRLLHGFGGDAVPVPSGQILLVTFSKGRGSRFSEGVPGLPPSGFNCSDVVDDVQRFAAPVGEIDPAECRVANYASMAYRPEYRGHEVQERPLAERRRSRHDLEMG